MRRSHAAKVDANQPEIVKALRKGGAFVQSIAQPFDLLAGFGGLWHVLEVKDGNKPLSAQALTPQQIQSILDIRNRAPVHVVRTVEEALDVVRGNKCPFEARNCPWGRQG